MDAHLVFFDDLVLVPFVGNGSFLPFMVASPAQIGNVAGEDGRGPVLPRLRVVGPVAIRAVRRNGVALGVVLPVLGQSVIVRLRRMAHAAVHLTAVPADGISRDTQVGVTFDTGARLVNRVRGLFLIDKEGTVQHQLVNNLPLGRSIDEALRMVNALQSFEKNGEVCPANWNEGSATIKPDPAKSKEFFVKQYA